MSEYNRHKWAMEWMHGGGRDPNGRSLDDEIKIGKEDWMERQRVAQGGRIEMKPGGLVEPGVMNYGTEDTWSIYKITRPGHPHQGKWAHRRPNKSIDYYDTKAQAQRIAERAKVIQYEAMEKPTTKAFQKKVKNLLDDGITKSQVAKKLEVNFKVVDRAIEEGNIKWKFEPYINVPKNLNYIKKNYGKKSRETMAKELFPDKEMPMSTKESRVGKLSQKLFDTGELKPTRVPTKEHAKKHGYYKDPEHEIVARVKKAKRDAVKARSVESIETAYAGTKKVQLSHMDDIYSQFTTGETLGYAPDKINQEFLKEYDNKMKSLYKKRDRLLKEKPKDLIKQLEQINKTGARLAGETGGYKSFKFVDPYTLKPYQFGVDAAKTIDPLGILEGKTIQEASMSADPTVKRSKQILDLSPVDRYFFEKNRKAVLASQKTIPKAIRGTGPTLSAFGAGAFDDLIKSPGAKKSIRGLGWLLGPLDVVLEGGMALPALARGNPQMARRSTTPGVFGSYGGTMLEDIRKYNRGAYRYAKAMKDINEWNALEADIERAKKVISGEIGGYPGVAKTDLAEAKKKQALLEKNFSETKEDDFQSFQDTMTQMAKDSREWSGDKNWLGQERGEQSTPESLEAAGVKPIDAHMMMQNADTTDEWRKRHQLEELDYELGGLDVETFLDPYGLKTQDPRYSDLPTDIASDYGSWEANQVRQKLEQLQNIDPGVAYAQGGIAGLLKK